MAFGFFGQFLTPNTNNFGYFAKCQAVTLFYQDLKYRWFCDMKTRLSLLLKFSPASDRCPIADWFLKFISTQEETSVHGKVSFLLSFGVVGSLHTSPQGTGQSCSQNSLKAYYPRANFICAWKSFPSDLEIFQPHGEKSMGLIHLTVMKLYQHNKSPLRSWFRCMLL